METAKPTTMLPDDVCLEILARLGGGDVATLFRCATACKGWRRLMAAPSFLRRIRWPPSLVGFFTQRIIATKFPGSSPTDANSQLAFVPLLSGDAPLGTRRRPLSSLVPAEDGTVVDRAVPLGTRGDLLVVRLFPHDLDMQPNVVRLAVCNMLARMWDVLPQLDSNTQFGYSNDPYSCDILPSSDRPAFKVLMIGRDKERSLYNLHTFASGEASWRAPIKCFDMMEHQIFSMQQSETVVCRGYAHWLFASLSNYFYILSCNVETGHISLKKLLSPTKALPMIMVENYRRAFSGIRLTSTAGATVLALRVYRDSELELWTHDQENEDGDAKWECSRVIDHKLTELIQQLEHPYCFWEAERSGTLLVKDHSVRRFYKACLNNGILEEITDQFPTNHSGTIMPIEIDWPNFFMLRLGGP